MMRGKTGYKKVRKRSGLFTARCKHCAFETGWDRSKNEDPLDPTVFQIVDGIRYQQRFIYKSHVKTKSAEQPLYAVRNNIWFISIRPSLT